MTHSSLNKVLGLLRAGKISVEEALDKIKHLPYEDMGFAKVDHHRHLRQGVPEVIFASGKTEQ